MKKKGILGMSVHITLVFALIAAFSLMSSSTSQAEEKGETINVGFLAALSGPDAGWGLPGLTGEFKYC